MDLLCSGQDLVWRRPWPADIIANLVSAMNREGTIKNSNLELAALVLHEATLLAAVPGARLAAPRSGSYNTLTISWSTKEASMINPVVTEILRISALHLRKFFINPSVFYHPGIKNIMADNASCLFEISDTSPLSHISATYPQLKSLWQISLPPPDLLSCMISTLHRKPCKWDYTRCLIEESLQAVEQLLFLPVDQY